MSQQSYSAIYVSEASETNIRRAGLMEAIRDDVEAQTLQPGPTEAVITSAARLSVGGQQLRTGRGTGGRPEVDDSLSPGCRYGRSGSAEACSEGGIPRGPWSGCRCAHLGQSTTVSALCRAASCRAPLQRIQCITGGLKRPL